ncbi:MAG: UDP-N-acetylmuramate dehydrogenase [Chitinivibrionales bacterium]|nr:UDP-N-acetylmuramate dehydrogenase [Chitinivibrionales bacterium]
MRIVENESLREKTTLQVGGPARYFCSPHTDDDALACVRWALEREVPVLVLGRGSNVCVSDRGWDGLVVFLDAAFARIAWDRGEATCMGGALLHTLVRESVGCGLAGIECLAGIPGTVGGAVVMNAGAFGQQIGTVVDEVGYIDLATGARQTATGAQLAFGYRQSMFQTQRTLILNVRCRFAPGEQQSLESTVSDILARRRDKQPLNRPNCGSVFKNPPGQGAGRHIEAAGLKGFSIGGMQVSPKHANFIVNTGGGTAGDFRRLVSEVQRVVREKIGIELEPEVRFVGRFD